MLGGTELVLDCQEHLPLPQPYPFRQFLMQVLQEQVVQLPAGNLQET